MALTIGNSSSTEDLDVTSETLSHNNDGDYLVVSIAVNDSAGVVSSVTFDGVTMTKLVEEVGPASEYRSYIYGLDGASSGTANVVVTYSELISRQSVSALSIGGTVGVGATGSNGVESTSMSFTVTTTEQDGYVVSNCICNDDSMSYTGSGTEYQAPSVLSNFRFSSVYTAFASSANVTDSWSRGVNRTFVGSGVEFYDAGGGGFAPIISVF